MVRKKIFIPALMVAAIVLTFAGCDKLPSTARRLNGSSLFLTVPPPMAGGVSAKFTLNLVLEYRIVSNADEVSGSLTQAQVQNVAGPINISLPHDGKWLVSAEWINLASSPTPFLIGADEVEVEGATNFDLAMGSLNSICYKISLSDVNSTFGYPDLFTFDTHVSGSSTITSGGDIQCLLDSAVPPSLYFKAASGGGNKVTYLGNGDWVDYTVVPSDAVYYGDSLAAKRAVLGPLAVMAANDVYAMKLSTSSTIAWIQVSQVSNLVPATFVDLYFRLNRHGYHYMKFDVTAYGDANCNTSGVSLY